MIKNEFVYVGIDLHKETHTAVIIDCYNNLLGQITFATASWGNSKLAQEYRAIQKNLIDNGLFRKAQQMNIDDIRALFGNKYDDAIWQMLKYTEELLKK